MTLSVPLIFISALLYVFLLPFCLLKIIKPAIILSIKKLIAINFKLINDALLLSNPEKISGIYLKILPARLGGFVHRHFNLFFLSSAWFIVGIAFISIGYLFLK